MASFERDKAGSRLDFAGLDVLHPVDLIPPNKSPMAINVRRYIKGAIKGRNLLTGALYTLAAALHSIRRLNDSTNPSALPSGYAIINGAGTVLSTWNSSVGVVNVASGLSGNPVSMVPFRPNASVQPWMYIGDSAAQGNVILATKYLISNIPVNFTSNGLMKVSSGNICWKTGVKEPQTAPIVTTQNTNVISTGNLLATAIPWTNYEGANADFDYGETNGYPSPTPDGTAPFVIDVANATSVTLAITGTATINGGTATPTTLGPSTSVTTNPGHYVQEEGTGTSPPPTATVVIGAFTDGAGNVVPIGEAPSFVSNIYDAGATLGTAISVPVRRLFKLALTQQGTPSVQTQGSFP